MATNPVILGIFCLLIAGGRMQPGRHLLNSDRQRVVTIARSQLGIAEQGTNTGRQVEAYLAAVRLKAGQPWCAAFVSWVFVQAGYRQPRSGWSPALFGNTVNTRQVLPGNVLGIYIPAQKRVAHVGLVERQQDHWIISIEGNTRPPGGTRDGVYRRRRLKKSIHCFADWLTPQQEGRL